MLSEMCYLSVSVPMAICTLAACDTARGKMLVREDLEAAVESYYSESPALLGTIAQVDLGVAVTSGASHGFFGESKTRSIRIRESFPITSMTEVFTATTTGWPPGSMYDNPTQGKPPFTDRRNGTRRWK